MSYLSIESLTSRLMAKVARSADGCWNWTGARQSNGYGRIAAGLQLGGPQVWMAHRAAYHALVGPIPEGLDIDHLCRNRACVNPSHLEPVTRRENTLRSPVALPAINARKVSCNSGHKYTDANTLITPQGSRHCRACHRINEARRRAKRSAEPCPT